MLIRFYGKAIPNKVASAFPRRDLLPDGKHASFFNFFSYLQNIPNMFSKQIFLLWQ